MINIMVTILLIALTSLMIYYIYREYRKSETIDEKVTIWLIILIVAVPILVYYIDRYNLISKLGWLENSNFERWFSFFATYLSSLISAVIAAVVLIVMTTHELNLDREKNQFDKRIQNAPIFKYEISNLQVPADFEYQILNKVDGNAYNLYLNIENLGLNHARNIEFEVNDGIIKKSQKFRFDMQSFLRKDDNKTVRFIFDYKYDSEQTKSNTKKITVGVSYQDLLNNTYYQEINIHVEVTNIFGSQYGGYKLYISSVEVTNEVYNKKDVK